MSKMCNNVSNISRARADPRGGIDGPGPKFRDRAVPAAHAQREAVGRALEATKHATKASSVGLTGGAA